MSRLTAWTIHLATLLVFGTGVALAWPWVFGEEPGLLEAEAYLEEADWQPWLQAVHVLAGPLLLFATGVVWMSHVRGRLLLGLPERRRTGLLLAGTFPPLVVLGYVLQVADQETLRDWLGWLHAGTGVLFGVIYVVHQAGPRAETPKVPTTNGPKA